MSILADYYSSLFGEALPSEILNAFAQYQKELLMWNEKINLTAIRTPEEIEIKHFMDSLSILPILQEYHVHSLIDIGTGAGFPGIPLKIVQPSLRVVLVDSIEKKTEFCRHIISTLQLKDIEVVTARAETVGQNEIYRERFDCAVARAVASLPVLLEYLLPLVHISGIAIAQKSASIAEEITQADKACIVLGGKEMRVETVTIPHLDAVRKLVIVEKQNTTPASYPRRIGLPAKKPL